MKTPIADKLIEATRRAWPEITGDIKPPPGDRFTIKAFQGQGSTSNNFFMTATHLDGSIQKFFIKQYGVNGKNDGFWQQQLAKDYALSRFVSRFLAESPYFRVPEVYFTIPEERLLVSRYICGVNLGVLFSRGLRWSVFLSKTGIDCENLVSRIGKGLAAMQCISLELFRDILLFPTWSDVYAASIKQFEEAAAILEDRGIYPELIRQSRYFVKRVLRDYFRHYHLPCFEHFDFILQNFMLCPNGDLYLFDFPNGRIGTPYGDVTHFIGSLEDISYMKTVSKKKIESFVSAFCKGVNARKLLIPDVLNAFSILIQFRSTMIILVKWQTPLWKRCLIEDPIRRFSRTVRHYLEVGRYRNSLL